MGTLFNISNVVLIYNICDKKNRSHIKIIGLTCFCMYVFNSSTQTEHDTLTECGSLGVMVKRRDCANNSKCILVSGNTFRKWVPPRGTGEDAASTNTEHTRSLMLNFKMHQIHSEQAITVINTRHQKHTCVRI